MTKSSSYSIRDIEEAADFQAAAVLHPVPVGPGRSPEEFHEISGKYYDPWEWGRILEGILTDVDRWKKSEAVQV